MSGKYKGFFEALRGLMIAIEKDSTKNRGKDNSFYLHVTPEMLELLMKDEEEQKRKRKI
jgi:hypothetical protein